LCRPGQLHISGHFKITCPFILLYLRTEQQDCPESSQCSGDLSVVFDRHYELSVASVHCFPIVDHHHHRGSYWILLRHPERWWHNITHTFVSFIGDSTSIIGYLVIICGLWISDVSTSDFLLSDGMVISECWSVKDLNGEILTQFVAPPCRTERTRANVKELSMATVKAEFGTERFMETAWKLYELR